MNKRTIVTHSVALLLGNLTCYFLNPPVETVRVEERIKYDVRTITRTVTLPDGTQTTDSVTEDRTSVKRDSESTSRPAPSWFASVGAVTELPQYKPDYVLSVGYRVMGPFYVLGSADTGGRVGAHLGITF